MWRQTDDGAAWAPLRLPIFRAFWIASLISNLGTWIHEVGAGWLMTSLDPDPQMVSAVRIAMSGPMIFLGNSSGRDRGSRRSTTVVDRDTVDDVLVCFVVVVVDVADRPLLPGRLLGLTFAIGLGLVMHVLTWQATIPVLVPPQQIARAIALGSISFNLARAAGPALGGVLIATAGVWVAFAVNALSFAGVLFVLLLWKREKTESSHGLSYRAALKEGFVYVVQERTMRNVLAGVMLFLLPATALWSLLPLVARQQLAWGAEGYGLLVTSIGVGAVVAARVLHALHRQTSDGSNFGCQYARLCSWTVHPRPLRRRHMVARCSGTIRLLCDGSGVDDLFNDPECNCADDVSKSHSCSWDGSLHDDHGVSDGIGIFDLGAGCKSTWASVDSVDCSCHTCCYSRMQFIVSS